MRFERGGQAIDTSVAKVTMELQNVLQKSSPMELRVRIGLKISRDIHVLSNSESTWHFFLSALNKMDP